MLTRLNLGLHLAHDDGYDDHTTDDKLWWCVNEDLDYYDDWNDDCKYYYGGDNRDDCGDDGSSDDDAVWNEMI